MKRTVIVAYEVDDLDAFASVLLALDAPPTGAREVFRQATPEYVDLERAFVVAARSFGAPAVERQAVGA